MLKILTILTLLYLSYLAAHSEAEKNVQQYVENHERQERQTGSCLGQQNPELTLLQESVADDNPELDTLTDGNNQNRRFLGYPNRNDELYYKENLGNVPNKPSVQLKETENVFSPSYDNERQNQVYNHNKDLPLEVQNEPPNQFQEHPDFQNQNNVETNKAKQADDDSSNPDKLKVYNHVNDDENNDESEYLLPARNVQANPKQQQSNLSPNCQSSFANNRRSNDETDSPLVDSENNQNSDVLVNQRRSKKTRYNNVALVDPVKGAGVSPMSADGVNLWEHNRVCYACTSASNPLCLNPDRRTTVKYCLKGHEACVTKTYHSGRDKDLILIRDCGLSCDDTDVPGPKYKTCKVCHSDVCNDEPFNGAFSVKSQSVIITTFLILLVKYTL